MGRDVPPKRSGGRPPKHDEKMVPRTVRATPTMWRDWSLWAEDEGMPLADLIRWTMEDARPRREDER